jgi:hypothetical protein
MHASPLLLINSAILGIAVPVVFGLFNHQIGNPVAATVGQFVSLAIVPVLAARIGYRQGFDRASANSATPLKDRQKRLF